MIGVMIHEILDEIGCVDAVGGLELGAVPLTGIVIAKSSKGSDLRGFIVRKEIKGRGGRKTGNPAGIEGSTVKEGDRVVILEDVTTTGNSAIKCGDRLRGLGCDVDREEGGHAAFKSAGIRLYSLILRSDVTGE